MGSLKVLRDKENRQEEVVDAVDAGGAGLLKVPEHGRLERLYTEQLRRAEEAQHELERLELELLEREQQLVESHSSARRSNESNRRLLEKLQQDFEFLEREAAHYKAREVTLSKELASQRHEVCRLKRVISEKDDEMVSLNRELEEVLLELESRGSQTAPPQSDESHSGKEEEEEEDDDDDDDNDDNDQSHTTPMSRQLGEDRQEGVGANDFLADESFGELEDDDEEYDHNVGAKPLPLTTELNMKLELKESQLKQAQFEIKSLKNEKKQLYDYVNKLLRNRPTPDQNDVLKQKLVRRKILRAVSINTADEKPLGIVDPKGLGSRRVISNFVHLKSYRVDPAYCPKRCRNSLQHYSINSDNEHEDTEMERHLFGYKPSWSGFGILGRITTVTPLHTILKSCTPLNEDIDLNID